MDHSPRRDPLPRNQQEPLTLEDVRREFQAMFLQMGNQGANGYQRRERERGYNHPLYQGTSNAKGRQEWAAKRPSTVAKGVAKGAVLGRPTVGLPKPGRSTKCPPMSTIPRCSTCQGWGHFKVECPNPKVASLLEMDNDDIGPHHIMVEEEDEHAKIKIFQESSSDELLAVLECHRFEDDKPTFDDDIFFVDHPQMEEDKNEDSCSLEDPLSEVSSMPKYDVYDDDMAMEVSGEKFVDVFTLLDSTQDSGGVEESFSSLIDSKDSVDSSRFIDLSCELEEHINVSDINGLDDIVPHIFANGRAKGESLKYPLTLRQEALQKWETLLDDGRSVIDWAPNPESFYHDNCNDVRSNEDLWMIWRHTRYQQALPPGEIDAGASPSFSKSCTKQLSAAPYNFQQSRTMSSAWPRRVAAVQNSTASVK